MSWRDQLQPASFRGVPFRIVSVENSGGRRVQVHEYPGRDLAYPEDLGRKGRGFTIEAYIIGADYMAGRDALIDALEKAGPGALVHPYRGTLQVQVTEYRQRETDRDGGMATFSITLVAAGDNRAPSVQVDTAAQVIEQADVAREVAKADFIDRYSVDGLPAFVADETAKLVSGLAGNLNGLLPPVPGLSSDVFSELASDAAALTSSPAGLVDRVLDAVRAVTDQVLPSLGGQLRPGGLEALLPRWQGQVSTYNGIAVLDTLRPHRDLLAWAAGLPSAPTSTATRRRQSDNQSAIAGLVSSAAVIESARLSSALAYGSHDEAVAVRDDLAERIDVVASSSTDDVYQALSEMRVAVVRDLTARGGSLARITRYEPVVSLPAVVIAHQVYGDASRAQDIVDRNRVRHPGFVAGGQSLEILGSG